MKLHKFLRILSRLEEQYGDGCWPWPLGRHNGGGYGGLRIGNPNWLAHRAAYHYLVRPLSPDEKACHTCDNPICCNPFHIFPGSQLDNIMDRETKKRGFSGKTHCRRGHELTADNVRLTPKLANGVSYVGRVCRACQLEHSRRYEATHRAERNARNRQPASS